MNDSMSDSMARRKRLDTFARVLDEAFTVPGTRIRVGWDAIVGLVPGIGDLVMTVLALYPVLVALMLKVPLSIVCRMLVNVGIDGLFGAVPIVGDLFDVAFKANRRNVDLLDRFLNGPESVKRSTHRWSQLWMAALAGLLLGLVLSIVITLAWAALWMISIIISILGSLTSLW